MRYLTIFFILIQGNCWCQDTVSTKFTGTFAIEVCSPVSPLCSDGFEETYRIYPYMVKLCSSNVLSCYDTVFSLERYNDHQVSLKQDEIYKTVNTDTNLLYVFNQKLKNKMNRYLKRNRIKKRFDGYLKYKVFKVDFLGEYKGEVSITVPTTDAKNGFVKIVTIPKFDVSEIISIQANEGGNQ